MSLRQQWRNFIVSPERTGRHLASIGAAVTADSALPMHDLAISRFLDRLADGITDVHFLAGVVDLLATEYTSFCARDLPTLLNSFTNDNIATNAIVGPALRGNTRWDLTYSGRMSGRISPVEFVTRLPVRNFSLPENELVSWLVADLSAVVSTIEARLGSRALPTQLRLVRDACRDAGKHPWFKEVTPPRLLETQMHTAATRQRLPAYRIAAKLAQRRNLFSGRDKAARWKHIVGLLSANWLTPVSDDDLFELYALALVLDLIEHECHLGPPLEFGLNVSGRSHIALFKSETSQVRVFFDQSPTGFLQAQSLQMNILGCHDGVRPAPRRPDIVVVRDTKEGRRVIFIEVKKSTDGGYLSDSIYKAFGYLTDFSGLWDGSKSNPKVALIVPEKIALKETVKIEDMSVVLVSSMDRPRLAEAIKVSLQI